MILYISTLIIESRDPWRAHVTHEFKSDIRIRIRVVNLVGVGMVCMGSKCPSVLFVHAPLIECKRGVLTGGHKSRDSVQELPREKCNHIFFNTRDM